MWWCALSFGLLSLAEDILPLEFLEIQIILEFLNDCLAAAGVSKATVIGKRDLNGGCQRGKLNVATGIYFTMW